MKDSGATMPEDLPAEEQIKAVKKRRRPQESKLDDSSIRITINERHHYDRRSLRRSAVAASLAEATLDIVEHHLLELGGGAGAAQGRGLLAVDEHRRCRCLAGARQRDADIGVLRFAGAVDDAAHHRDGQRLHAWIAALPLWHLVADEVLDVAGKLLEGGRSGAPAAGTGGDERHEAAEAHALQQLLSHLHLKRAVAVRLWRERDADGVSDALLKQHRERGGGSDDALRAHAGFGKPEM